LQVWQSEEEDAQSDSLRKKAVKVKHVKRRERKTEKKVRMVQTDDVTDDVTDYVIVVSLVFNVFLSVLSFATEIGLCP